MSLKTLIKSGFTTRQAKVLEAISRRPLSERRMARVSVGGFHTVTDVGLIKFAGAYVSSPAEIFNEPTDGIPLAVSVAGADGEYLYPDGDDLALMFMLSFRLNPVGGEEALVYSAEVIGGDWGDYKSYIPAEAAAKFFRMSGVLFTGKASSSTIQIQTSGELRPATYAGAYQISELSLLLVEA